MKEIKTSLDKYLDRMKISEADKIIEEAMKLVCGFKCFYEEARLSLDSNKPIIAYRKIKKAIEFAKKKEEFIKGYKLIGEILESIGSFDEALPFLEESLKLAKELKDIEEQISILNSIANIYFRKEDIEKSLEYCQKAIQLYNLQEKLLKTEEIAITYNNAAIIYNKTKQHEKAIEHLKKAIKLSIDPEKLPLYKLNLGYTYTKIKDFKNAEKYLLEALESFKKAKNKLGEAKTYRYLAMYYRERKDLEKAAEYYQKAYQILNSIGKKYDAEKILREIEELNNQSILP